MTDKMTILDLAAKTVWEGGIIATLEYGIHADDLADPDLAAAWGALDDIWDVVRAQITTIEHWLAQPATIASTTTAGGDKMTTARLAQKIEWEGGVLGALEYGIMAEDIADPALAAAWGVAREAYADMMPGVAAMDKRLRAARAQS